MDTNRTEESVQISEVSPFQCMEELFLGRKEKCPCGGPHSRGVLERCSAVNYIFIFLCHLVNPGPCAQLHLSQVSAGSCQEEGESQPGSGGDVHWDLDQEKDNWRVAGGSSDCTGQTGRIPERERGM